MTKNIFLAMLIAIQSAMVYAKDTHSICCDAHNNTLLNKYYIGDYKRPDGTIVANCYIQILHSADGLAFGTDVICPPAN